MRRSCSLQVLPPRHSPAREGREWETMDQPVTTDPHAEGIIVTEFGEDYASFKNPSTPTLIVVELPSSHDSTFHFLMEGHSHARD